MQSGGLRHPREMSVADVEAFLSMRANERRATEGGSGSALNALLQA
jgi:hypothetical protein